MSDTAEDVSGSMPAMLEVPALTEPDPPEMDAKQKKKKYEVLMKAVDRDKYYEKGTKRIPISQLDWDRTGSLGQTRILDDDDVQARLQSLQQNPPPSYLTCTVWIDEGVPWLAPA